MKRGRSKTPKGQSLKRRRAMTKEEASKLTTDVSSSVVLRTRVPRIVPPTMICKLKFNVNVAIDAPSGAIQAYLFRANDGFDPDYTGTGAQPKGLDQYFAFYRKALCKNAKITVKCLNAASTFDAASQWGISLRTSTGTEVTPRGYVEDPQSVWALAGNFQTLNQECSLTYTPYQAFGAKGDLKDDDELHFTEAASPGKVAYFHVWNGSWVSLYNAPAHQMIGTIEYTFEFFEPKDVGPS